MRVRVKKKRERAKRIAERQLKKKYVRDVQSNFVGGIIKKFFTKFID